MAPRAGLLQHSPMKVHINPGLSLSLDDKWGSRHGQPSISRYGGHHVVTVKGRAEDTEW
jgi:hypothetical protein